MWACSGSSTIGERVPSKSRPTTRSSAARTTAAYCCSPWVEGTPCPHPTSYGPPRPRRVGSDVVGGEDHREAVEAHRVDRRLDPVDANLQVGPRTSPVEYARLGRAARALGEFQLANDAYRIATEKAPNDPSLHTGWGELFLQAHDNAEAAKSFQDALAADDKWVPALLGMAHALVDVNPPGAEKAVQQARAGPRRRRRPSLEGET